MRPDSLGLVLGLPDETRLGWRIGLKPHLLWLEGSTTRWELQAGQFPKLPGISIEALLAGTAVTVYRPVRQSVIPPGGAALAGSALHQGKTDILRSAFYNYKTVPPPPLYQSIENDNSFACNGGKCNELTVSSTYSDMASKHIVANCAKDQS